ncbi:MAG: hypothetical protein SFY80_04845 [Verrucomicrobiota bacterium]|nr:hypothetical protein [Verrucomicrobiota bacterium]
MSFNPVRFLLPAVVGILLLIIPSLSRAQVVQGFESGLPSTLGDVGWVNAATAGTPPEGLRMAFLTTFGPANFGGAFGSDAVPVANLQTYAGVPAGTIILNGTNLGIQGSAIQLTLALNPGDQLGFKYKLLTDESQPTPVRKDFAWLVMKPEAGATYYQAFDHVGMGGFSLTSAAGPLIDYFSWETPWRTYSVAASVSETFTITIGIADATSNQFNSGMLIDAITVTPVPEPAVWGLLGAFLAILLVGIRRKR